MNIVNISKGAPNTAELAWMWLPVFIGQDHYTLEKLQEALTEKFLFEKVDDDTLDAVHDFAVSWLCDHYKVEGLDKYLNGIKEIRDDL